MTFSKYKKLFRFWTRNRYLDLSNSKKQLNLDELAQIFSNKNQENSLVINANIKKAQAYLNKTSANSVPPNQMILKFKLIKTVG
ncbi:hypothetical protein [Mesomycoplasma ovipneumoniae]|uniref:hypothetical protein n=1 Tax=Mesomycoplasma ovipneumoniae TaxID=29562 RepID=UPI0005C5762B|nr:hypothetical protein [Mesomycoplasma ovipneumoniae]